MPGQKTDLVNTIPLLNSSKTSISRAWRRALPILLMMLLSTPYARADFSDAVDAYNRGDYEVAFQEWLLYAAENDSRALYNLGQMYRLGRGVDQNLLIAQQYYRRASALGHVGAHGNLGSMFFSKDPPDFQQALYHWRIAARGGHARSQYLLGIQYFNGEQMAQDLVRAYAWVTLASEAGLTEAADAAASMEPYLEDGQITEAKHLASTLMAPGVVVARVDDQQASGPSDAPDSAADDAGSAAAPVAIESSGAVLDEAEIASRISEAADQDIAAADSAGDQAEIQGTEGSLQIRNEESISPSLGNPTQAVEQEDGRFRVQVASFRSADTAESHWGRLAGEHSDLLAGQSHRVAVAELGEKGTFYRLQIGSFATHSAAQSFCGTLQTQQVDCFVARP